MLEAGDTAPTFELPEQDGETVALSEYEGQRVVLYFYPRADTPGCTKEACGFRDEWDAFADRNVAVLGVSDDPVDDLAAFAAEYDLPFTLLSDEDGAVAARYDSYGEKNMFGNTFDGVFRNTYVIDPDGVIERVYEGVSPEGHAEEILADLD
ncbi:MULTISPECIES: thioredoxin-dependent thiol peroxidase [Halomicrobium]|uniref:thioredoxin-dependent peroxiredoxin n=2 Tax=Halomicrobium mukohataei TaxID=57705 RepID=C7NWJ6_HALMD|nr:MULTISPECIES: thioredoxin-dependent thiol peroxidase [Halomicrobium]ACV48206.1 alkyl hydroperoxide reductase/ Thiol specific antioxidant/ Mal allergen [Halomicrobium mukohataei DSM 12286]QCD66628.1 thioredoxin-dependent thiol peroxidase [Halomicrobium mukohataei]QFR21434.1 thioredoxin-dependent thiol peroxidase [Halomicrobium sp. ZPS1]